MIKGRRSLAIGMLLLPLFLIVVGLLSAGCDGGRYLANTPEGVVKKFLDALQSVETEAALECLDPELRGSLDSFAQWAFEFAGMANFSDLKIETVENTGHVAYVRITGRVGLSKEASGLKFYSLILCLNIEKKWYLITSIYGYIEYGWFFQPWEYGASPMSLRGEGSSKCTRGRQRVRARQ